MFTKGEVVRFTNPLNDSEACSTMIVLEDRDTRVLVVDADFINDPAWAIKPTSVYLAADLEVVN